MGNELAAVRTSTLFQPQSLAELMEMAQAVSKSALVPPAYRDKPGDIVVAVQMGAEVGLAPLQALQSIAVINGRPAIYGDGFWALVLSSPHYARHEEEFIGDPGRDDFAAVTRIWRSGNETPHVGSFSIADAKRAGVYSKDTYQKFGKDMLRWRARHRAAQAGFADALRGLIPVEIAEDFRHVPSAVVPQPKRKSEALPPPPPPADVHHPSPEPTPQEPPPAPQAPEPPAPPPAVAPARNGVALISDAQRKRLYAIYKQAGKTDEQVKAYLLAQFQLEHTADIPRSVYDIICAWAAMPSDASGNA